MDLPYIERLATYLRLAFQRNAAPTTNMKSERNWPLVNGPVNGASGSLKEFADNAHQRIKEEKASGRYAVRFFELEANPDQEGEEQKTFQKRFIELARVARRENAGEDFTNLRAVPRRGNDLGNVIKRRG